MKVKKYSLWFLFNFILCLTPIIILWLISFDIDGIVFSSFIAYSYTLILVSLFVYDKFRKRDDLLFWLSIAFSLLLLAFYILYPDVIHEDIQRRLSNNIEFFSALILLIVLFISFLLYKPVVDEEIKSENEQAKFKSAKETKDKLEKVKAILREENE